MHSINLLEIKQFFKAFTKPKRIKTILKPVVFIQTVLGSAQGKSR